MVTPCETVAGLCEAHRGGAELEVGVSGNLADSLDRSRDIEDGILGS